MQVPLEWSHRGLSSERAQSIEALVRQRAEKLQRHAPDLLSCRVAVEQIQLHQRSGSPWRVRIEVTLPRGIDLVVSREPGQGENTEAPETAVRAAFTTMERQVDDARAKRRGDVKAHVVDGADEGTAIVARIFADQDYAFLQSTDGIEIYAHRNAVDDFDRLAIGTRVRYVMTNGDKGPQATTVHILEKPGEAARPTGTP